MQSERNILTLLRQVNAMVTESHIVYTSGKHGASYFNKDAIYPHTQLTSQFCSEIAQHFVRQNIEVVIAPAVGGIILSQWVAHHLTLLTQKEVLGIYAEKSETSSSFVIKRGYDQLCRAKRVLVVEDVLTTGGSVRKVVEAVQALPAHIIGVAALCNRGQVTAQACGVNELFALAEVRMQSWDEEECPLCQKHVPINLQVGKGREYLQKRPHLDARH